MFTGIIEEIGRVQALVQSARARQLQIAAPKVCEDVKVDDSICVNGVCLTVVACAAESFTVQAVDETLRKTTLGNLAAGSRVNLERALRLGDRLGGHLVQGHVDGVARVAALEPQEAGKLMRLELPRQLLRYVIPQGAIAVEGVSLTVARLEENAITIALIPHTLQQTTLDACHVGDRLNVETDMIARHVERFWNFSRAQGLNEAALAQWGYGSKGSNPARQNDSA